MMRLPHVRLTVRSMMIGVAVAAILIWCVQICQRREMYRARRDFYSSAQRLYRPQPPSCYCECRFGVPSCDDVCALRYINSEAERICFADHLAQLEWKYAKAVSRPWLSVTPDPPEPPFGKPWPMH